MATDFDKKLVNGAVLMDVAKGILERAEDKDTALKTELEGKITGVQSQVTTLKGDLDDASEELQNSIKAVDDKLTKQMNPQEEGSLAKQIADEKKRAETEEGKLDGRITSIYEQVGDLVGNEVTQQIEGLTTRIATAENKITTAESDIDKLEGRMDTAEDDIDALEVRMTTAEGNITKAQGAADKAQGEVDALEGVVGTLRTEFDAEVSRATSQEQALGKRIDDLINSQAEKDSVQDVAIKAAKDQADKGVADAAQALVDAKAYTDTREVEIKKYTDQAEADAIAAAEGKVNALATGAVAANTTAIATLNGGEEVEGSVDAKIKAAIDVVSESADALEERVEANENAIAALNGENGTLATMRSELIDYADQAEADAIAAAEGKVNALATGAVKTNTEAIAKLNGGEEVEGSIAAAVAAEKDRAMGVEAGLNTRLGTAEQEIDALQSQLVGIEAGEGKVKAAIDAAQTAAEGKVTALAKGQVKTNTEAIAANAEAIELLNGDENQAGSVAAKIKAAIEAVNGNAQELGQTVEGIEAKLEGLEGDTVQAAINQAEADAIAAAEGKVNALANGQVKTNTGAIATNTAAIAANAEAIATLNGTGEGSVSKQVTDAIAGVVASAPEDFDTLKEIADYIASDKTGAAGLSNRVAANEAAIAKLNGGADEKGSVANAVKGEADRAVAKEGELAQAIEDLEGVVAKQKTDLQAEIDSDVKVVADELTKQKDAEREGTLAHKIATEAARADAEEKRIVGLVETEARTARAAEQANANAIKILNGGADEEGSVANAVKDLRGEVVSTFNQLNVEFAESEGETYIQVKLDGAGLGGHELPLGKTKVPVMTSDDVTALLGELNKVQE